MKEIWKDIKGYENKYQISNLGRVKSLEFKNRQATIKREKILKINNSTRYPSIDLMYKGKRKNIPIHRLVAKTFIANPNNYLCVNHKDENKSNNNVENLEWCTHKYNSNYGTCKWRIGIKHRKKVLQYDINGNFIKEWESITQISNFYNFSIATISCCCAGKQKKAHGYIWKFKKDSSDLPF